MPLATVITSPGAALLIAVCKAASDFTRISLAESFPAPTSNKSIGSKQTTTLRLYREYVVMFITLFYNNLKGTSKNKYPTHLSPEFAFYERILAC